ncbi:hypothetical protein JCM10213_000156 [Rhodosporidiobolus nylandii]
MLQPPNQPHATTSRTSLDDLAFLPAPREKEEGRIERRGGAEGDKHRGDWQLEGTRSAQQGGKGKGRGWEVELAIVGKDGTRRKVDGPEADEGWLGEGEQRTPPAPSAVRHTDAEDSAAGAAPPPTAFSASAGETPPPSAEPPPPPAERPPLQPLHGILKRPGTAHSTSGSRVESERGAVGGLLPLPSPSPRLTASFASDEREGGEDKEEDVDAKDTLDTPSRQIPPAHSVLFSTPGTLSSVLPLSSPSALSSSAPSHSHSHSHSQPEVGVGTFKSWKSSVMGRRSGMYDKKRLASLGYDEEMDRSYDFWASWGLSLCNIGALPGTTLGVLTALRTGGPGLYSIAWPISGLFMIGLAAVLGELASTYPVAGASFTWVFRLCRSKRSLDPWARFASWLTGSALLCSHILLQIVVTWQFAHNLLGVITLFTGQHYSVWVTIAVGWFICLFAALVVSSRLSRNPWLWRTCGALIVVFFLVINITMLVHADVVQPARFVFTTYHNSTGFESRSYVYMIGWCLTCVATGMEASAHMAEDTKKPSRTVPLAMFWSTAASYLMGWVTICVLLATLNRDGLDPNLQPSIAIIANSIPRAYTTLILVFVLLSFVFQCVAQLLATSRFIWALARESALPFSTFFRRLSPSNRQPSRAIWGTIAIAFPSLIFLAINTSIISTTLLEGAGITATCAYVVPLLIYLFCPSDVLRGDGRAKWTLRGASKVVAAPVVLFLLTFMITMCLPTGYPVTSLTCSYASVVLIGVLLLSSIAWVLYGNSHYAGPIKTTTRWTIGAEVDLPSTSSAGGTQPAAAKKKKTTGAHVTTSFAHGRSAHVWATSTGGQMTGERTARTVDSRGGGTELGTVRSVGTGTSTSGFTSGGSWTSGSGSEDDEDEGQYESDEEDEGGRSRVDEERRAGR